MTRKISRLALPLCLLSLGGLLACSDSPDPVGPESMSSFEVIQHEIFEANCVSCHSQGTSFARQSGLVLTADVAYQQLVNAPPTNRAAAAADLVRISDQGLPGLLQSYFWAKINAHDQDHFYADHSTFGEIMPLGRPPLTNGQIEFIRRWIVAGAPEKGAVVDPGLLADEQRYELAPYAPLSPPVDGIQLNLGPFEVIGNFEREVFSYVPLNNPEVLYVNSFDIAMRPGSHHLILYTYPDYTPDDVVPQPFELRDLRDETGSYVDEQGIDYFDWRQVQYATPIIIAQSRRLDFRLPPGVAMKLPVGSSIDINVHYANSSDATIEGEVNVNLGLLNPDEVEHEAEIFALGNFDIDLPAGQVTTLEKEFIFKEDRHLIQLVSHTHERMVEFTAEIIGGDRSGELIYITYDWEHPAPLRFDPPLFMAKGQGLRVCATYDNDTDGDLFFGFTRKEEMMILYGFYYTE